MLICSRDAKHGAELRPVLRRGVDADRGERRLADLPQLAGQGAEAFGRETPGVDVDVAALGPLHERQRLLQQTGRGPGRAVVARPVPLRLVVGGAQPRPEHVGQSMGGRWPYMGGQRGGEIALRREMVETVALVGRDQPVEAARPQQPLDLFQMTDQVRLVLDAVRGEDVGEGLVDDREIARGRGPVDRLRHPLPGAALDLGAGDQGVAVQHVEIAHVRPRQARPAEGPDLQHRPVGRDQRQEALGQGRRRGGAAALHPLGVEMRLQLGVRQAGEVRARAAIMSRVELGREDHDRRHGAEEDVCQGAGVRRGGESGR